MRETDADAIETQTTEAEAIEAAATAAEAAEAAATETEASERRQKLRCWTVPQFAPSQKYDPSNIDH